MKQAAYSKPTNIRRHLSKICSLGVTHPLAQYPICTFIPRRTKSHSLLMELLSPYSATLKMHVADCWDTLLPSMTQQSAVRERTYIQIFSLPWEPYTVCRHEYGKCSLTSNESFLNNSSMALNSLYLKHARPESSFPWTQSLLICSMADSNFQETLVLVGCATVRDAKITTQQILSRRAIFGRHCLSRRRLICSVLRCDLAESLFAIVTAINHGADFIPRCQRRCSPSLQFGVPCLIFCRRFALTDGT